MSKKSAEPQVFQPNPERGYWAVQQANKPSDYIVLTVTIGIFILMSGAYFIISYLDQGDFVNETHASNVTNGIADPEYSFLGVILTIVGAVVVYVVLLLVGMLSIRMMRQTMLGNSLEVEFSDYAWLRDWSNTVARDLNMPQVEIFVTQNPLINAYAFGFARPYTIVLFSGSVRYLTEDELKVVVVHEMAHIKYKHTFASTYLMPYLVLPIINVVGGWIAGFWNRRAELTSDRLALMYIGDSELVKASLIKVHVGPDLAKSMNDVARQWLQYKAERPMNRFAQTFSSHPFLVRRLSQIDRYKYIVEPPVDQAPVAPQPTPTQTTV